MKKPVEVWQAIIATLLLFGTIVTVVANQAARIAKDETEISNLEQNKAETDKHFDEVNMNLKEMNNQLTSIRVLLEDKADRK